MEIVEQGVYVRVSVAPLEFCDGRDTHYSWTAPDWEYMNDGCYGTPEEAIEAGLDTVTSWVEQMFRDD